MTTRKARGARTQDVVAAWFRGRGWDECRDVAAGESGADLVGMLGLAGEVKARRGFEPLKWLRQARRNAAGRIPFVVFRCDGQGEQNVGEWGVLVDLQTWTDVLREANYAQNDAVARLSRASMAAEPFGVNPTTGQVTRHYPAVDFSRGGDAS